MAKNAEGYESPAGGYDSEGRAVDHGPNDIEGRPTPAGGYDSEGRPIHDPHARSYSGDGGANSSGNTQRNKRKGFFARLFGL